MLANASNYMLYEKSVNDYDGLMNASFKEVKETQTPYFGLAQLNEVHFKNKDETMTQVW